MRQPAESVESRSGTPGTSRRTQRALTLGTVLEQRYEIQRVIGRGGMSTVYQARDLRFGQVERLCAVKEMFDIDPDARDRAIRLINFEREAALLATLSHPSIPRIYDYFTHGGLVYLVLEYVDGQDLERLLASRKAPFAEREIVQWANEICDVLTMLHEQQPDPIIFRDLKPSNIMLRNTGHVALIDFGIARTIQGRQRGTMIGTEGYAPPEQYRGIADVRGDIYALGATLHHLATNSDPRLETPFTFQERPVRTLNPAISEEFAAVIMKMVAYNPSDRYQHVRDVRADLDVVRQRAAAASAPPLNHVIPAPLNGATTPPVAEVERGDEPPALGERKGSSKKRAARRRRVEAADVPDRVVWTTPTLDEVRGSATFDGQVFVIGSYDQHLYALNPSDGSPRWKVRTNRGIVSRPAMAGDVLVFGSEDHSVYAVDRASGQVVWTHRTGMPVRSSPVVLGSSVAIGSDDGVVYCLDASSGKLVWRQRTWAPVRSSPVASDRLIVIGSDDQYIYAIDGTTGRVEWRAGCGGPIHSPLSTAGTSVYVAARSGVISAFKMTNGERLWQHDTGAPVLSSPRESQGMVVFGSTDGSLVSLSAEDGAVRWIARIANQITATPLLAERFGYIGTIDGDFVCFDLHTGDVVWRHHVGGGIVSTPAYGNGVIVVGSIDGRVYGIGVTDSEIRALQKG